jgi:hypothetical protein
MLHNPMPESEHALGFVAQILRAGRFGRSSDLAWPGPGPSKPGALGDHRLNTVTYMTPLASTVITGLALLGLALLGVTFEKFVCV